MSKDQEEQQQQKKKKKTYFFLALYNTMTSGITGTKKWLPTLQTITATTQSAGKSIEIKEIIDIVEVCPKLHVVVVVVVTMTVFPKERNLSALAAAAAAAAAIKI